MSALDNARHESFAQGVALGKSATEAYKDAGYSEKGADVSASRLLGNASVKSRVQEIQARLVIKAGITRSEYIASLVDGLTNLPKDHGNWPRIADLTAKACGFNEPEKLDITANMEVEILMGAKKVEY
jgi:hypothetical protein